jgi:hypothetical protein
MYEHPRISQSYKTLSKQSLLQGKINYFQWCQNISDLICPDISGKTVIPWVFQSFSPWCTMAP